MTRAQKIDNLSATLSLAEQELRATEPKRLDYRASDAWIDALSAHQGALRHLVAVIEHVTFQQTEAARSDEEQLALRQLAYRQKEAKKP